MITPRRQRLMPTRGLDFSLAHVTEADGRLIVTQSNGPALRNFRNTVLALLGGVPCLVFVYLHSTRTFGLVGPNEMLPPSSFLFLGIPLLVMFFQSLNRLFGKETFIFDRNEGVFIRNGFTVGPLRIIRAVTAQVTGGSQGQYPMFRLILELPRCETVTIVRTHDVPAEGEFSLSQNGFGDPNKRFAAYTPWLDYDEQNLVPFLPPEIVALQQTIRKFIGEEAIC